MEYLQYIIPAASLIVVQIIISLKERRVQDVKFDDAIKEVKNDIERLEKKVEKHNNFIERVYELEKNVNLHDEKIKVANHRIEDLEKANV